mgnify:CR=1 FL=1
MQTTSPGLANKQIAITGKMCSGKSSIANVLMEKDNRYQIYSFGRKVKDVAKDLFDMKDKDRTLLTSIGTKMREINPDVWINYVLKQTQDQTHCIVDDLRYQNEYEALSNAGFNFDIDSKEVSGLTHPSLLTPFTETISSSN